MNQEQPLHHKIRFRRDEIADLGALPSACKVPPLGRSSLRRGGRLVARWVASLAAVVLLLAILVYGIALSGIGTERLRAAAESAVKGAVGVDVNVAVGPARITLDRSSFLAVQVNEVALTTKAGEPMAEAAKVRFGVRLLPLLSGEVRLTSARISGARIVTAALPSSGGDWSATVRNAQGLLDPDKVVAAAFGAVHEALDAVRLDSIREIDLADVAIELPPDGPVRLVRVAGARLRQSGAGQIRLSATLAVDDRPLTVIASASRDDGARRITALSAEVRLSKAAPEPGAAPVAVASPGEVTLQLTGQEGSGEGESRLVAAVSLAGAVLDLDAQGLMSADADLRATLATGTNKLSVDRLVVRTGRNIFDFQGSIGPTPPTGAVGEEPSYRYDMVSDGSTLAPEESLEPAMKFIARIAGEYLTASKKLSADTIAVKSDSAGEVLGTAALEFVEGKVPGMFIALNVHNMQVSHVKQLWPWFSAGSARRWVLKNLFGGRVTDGNLQYRVAPGRSGNGVPLTGDEVFGRFRIDGSRFDTAGGIPPVRDAVGAVEFRGNSVDISLDTGTVYMPSGRTVAASNGTMTIEHANRSPVIGVLDMDVAGDAPAIAELASYEPIDAMRHVGILPKELSGTVTGNVKADIPLQSGADKAKLGFLVALDYRGLALEKPVDGQTVTAADGSIIVDPQKAVISAKAQLNGLPAEVDLVEPLVSGGPVRSRKVALTLDDKTRETFMPGLSALLGGTVKVALDRNHDGTQTVKADLTGARLDIPWVGWSKGAGIPADVAFTMSRAGDATTLSGFDLSGKTFGIDGNVVLSDGSLSSANFSKVRLNRDDDVAVSVKRSSKGYAVNVRGNALDVRSLIKQFSSDVATAAKAAGGDSISVSADVKSLTGFHGEKLSNLNLEYSAAGSTVNGLKVSAASSSGASITITDTAGGGNRALDLKSADAGAILRFLNIYEHVQGGAISLTLGGGATGPLTGKVVARDFHVVDEPKLASIVSTTPAGDSRSLNQAVKGDIDTSRVKFDRASAEIDKGSGYVKLANGVLRGPYIGTTFQGTLYDQDNNMDMTGTFMPVYGLNRIFGEIPILGAILGNGRDRGLIGVTYRLRGDANKPDLDINPLSVIAPGIFRSIFEYR